MSDKSDTSDGQSAKDDVVDAEIISEESTTHSYNTSPNKASKISMGAKLGWGLSFLLIAFVGGLFAEPWISKSLVNLGLKDAPAETQAQPDPDLEALKEQLAAQEELIKQLGSTVENQAVSVAEAASGAQKAQDDLAILAAAAATDPNSGAGQTADTGAVDALKVEITELRQLLTDSAAVSPDSADVDALEGRIEIARTEARVMKSRLAILEAALEKVSSGNLEDSPRGRLAVTLSELRRKADGGQAFASLLDSLRLDLTMLPALDQQKAGGALAVLDSHGAGVDSQLSLISDFPDLVRGVKAASATGTTESWLASLFVTRDLTATDPSVDATLNTAETLIRSDHLMGAIEALNALPEAAKPAAQDWTARAAIRARTLDAIDTLFKLAAGAPTQSPEQLTPESEARPLGADESADTDSTEDTSDEGAA